MPVSWSSVLLKSSGAGPRRGGHARAGGVGPRVRRGCVGDRGGRGRVARRRALAGELWAAATGAVSSGGIASIGVCEREREREREREKRERKREREDTHTLTLTHTHTHKERERLGKYRSSQRNDTLQGARFPPASSQYRVRDAARPFSTGGEEGRDYGRFICALAR